MYVCDNGPAQMRGPVLFCEFIPVNNNLCMNIILSVMVADIDKLAIAMGLSQYQKNVLKSNMAAYNFGRLVKRGTVLCAPRAVHSLRMFLCRVFSGQAVDLIGKNKMLVCNQRGVKFLAHGFYRVTVGPYTYYADENGDIVARDSVIQQK